MAKEENYFDKPPMIRKGDENDRAYGKSHLKSKRKALEKVKGYKKHLEEYKHANGNSVDRIKARKEWNND